MKKKEKKEIRALGRMLAHELSNEELKQTQGAFATSILNGSSCGANDVLRDVAP